MPATELMPQLSSTATSPQSQYYSTQHVIETTKQDRKERQPGRERQQNH